MAKCLAWLLKLQGVLYIIYLVSFLYTWPWENKGRDISQTRLLSESMICQQNLSSSLVDTINVSNGVK